MSPCAIGPTMTICRPEPGQPAIMWTERLDLGTFVMIGDALGTMGTRYKPDVHVIRHQIQPFDLRWADCCHRVRWAARLDVIGGGGWYEPSYRCADGHGCKVGRKRQNG